MPPPFRKSDARMKLLDASMSVIREKGFSSTTVDDLCAAAGVTKGAFFHHFESKEALGIAAAAHWSEMTASFFAAAPYHDLEDPFSRLIGYIDFRKKIIAGDIPEFTCLVGTMAQEVFASHPAIRDACGASIFSHAATLVPDIEAAMEARGLNPDWSAENLAAHTQAVLQGSFILAKASNNPEAARDSIEHLRRYLLLLFDEADASMQPEKTTRPAA